MLGKPTIMQRFIEAFFSTCFWFVVWVVSVWAFALWAQYLGLSSVNTGIAISLTIVISHFPKLFAIMFDTDTDFQGIYGAFDRWRRGQYPTEWKRMIMASVIVLILAVYLIPTYSTELALNFDPLHLEELWMVTMKNLPICITLFVAQMIFSFPSSRSRSVDASQITNLPGA